MRRLKEVLLSQVVLNTLYQSASSYLGREMRGIDTQERTRRPPTTRHSDTESVTKFVIQQTSKIDEAN